MRFSWTGLILAPLAVPVIFSALLSSLGGAHPVLGFLILLIPGCIVSYGSTMFLFLPCLFLLSLWRPLTGLKVCLLGLGLGGAVLMPLTVMAWKSSGTDSGPPTESFFTFFVHWIEDPLTAVFPLAGLITAGLYWWLGTRQGSRLMPAQATPDEYSNS
ncbi:MAG: hypothetical protein WAV27_10775 [Xanthobacteraceae bacterium]